MIGCVWCEREGQERCWKHAPTLVLVDPSQPPCTWDALSWEKIQQMQEGERQALKEVIDSLTD